MKTITEYLSTKVAKPIVRQDIIYATDENIHQIVKDELDRLGHDADLNHIDVSGVTKMESLFSFHSNVYLSEKYNDLNPDISQWNVSNVKKMQFMFWGCKQFNCDISGWDVSNVEDMVMMFNECYEFNQDLSQWNVSKVETHSFMFVDCPIKKEFKPKFKK